jgi:SurA N-terminal domain
MSTAIRGICTGGVIFALTGLLACGSATTDTVVVRVGDASITRSVLRHWMAALAPGRRIPADRAEYGGLQRQALDHLIAAHWLIAEAAAQGLPVSKHQASTALAQAIRRSFPGGAPEFHSYLTIAGRTVDDTTLEIQSELAASQLLRLLNSQATHATHLEAVDYYRTHRHQFLLPEQREIEITDRKTPTEANRLLNEVAHGRPLPSVAQPATYTRRAHMSANVGARLERAIFSAAPHVLIGIVPHYVFYFIFEVERITPPRDIPFRSVERAILKQLAHEYLRRTRGAFLTAWRAHWAAHTSCSPGYVVPLCRQYRGPATPGHLLLTLSQYSRQSPFI